MHANVTVRDTMDSEMPANTRLQILSYFTLTNIFVSFAVYIVIRLYRQHAALAHFKGPPGVGISKKWLLFDCLWSSKMHLKLWEVNKRYGRLKRYTRDNDNGKSHY